MSSFIDHIVYAVPDFDAALIYLENQFGILPSIGGRHLQRGTKNALINLGNQCYLEILAVDHENTDFHGQRWMGMDLIGQPAVTRWAVKSDNIEKESLLLAQFRSDLGVITSGERKTTDGSLLKWKMTLPAPAPVVEIAPFLLDWSKSAFHPCDRLDSLCELVSLDLYHPQPELFNGLFKSLSIDLQVLYGEFPKINVKIKGRTGIITL